MQAFEHQQLYKQYDQNKTQSENWKNVVDQIPESIVIINFEKEVVFSNYKANKLFEEEIKELNTEKISFNMLEQFFKMLKIIEFEQQQQKKTTDILKQAFQQKVKSISFSQLINELILYQKNNPDNERTSVFIQEQISSRQSIDCQEVLAAIQLEIKYMKFFEQDCFLMTAKDISESLEELKNLNQYKMNVVSSFSHELRTPLNGAIQPLQLGLKDPTVSKSFKRNNIKNALASLFILENTLNDIIDLTLLTTNQFSLMTCKINLSQFIKEIRKVICIQMELKNLTFHVDIDESNENYLPEEMHTDYKRLKQVVLNLLTNAIKFTNQGFIFLRMKYSNNERELIISIEDTGIGMTAKRLQEVQWALDHPELFFSSKIQESCSTTNFSLGLPISQNIAIHLNENCKGIQVSSQYKCGSKFTFCVTDQLPEISHEPTFASFDEKSNTSNIFSQTSIKIPQFMTFQKTNLTNQLTEDQQIDSEEQPLQLCPIIEQFFLIVDDDCFNLLALEMHLNFFHKKCIKAFNGIQAIEILESIYNSPTQSQEISLIFMDYQMPEMNGLEATKKISQLISQQVLPYIPIVACTAFGAKEQISQCREAGMIGHLIKPVTHAQLEAFLKKEKFIS